MPFDGFKRFRATVLWALGIFGVAISAIRLFPRQLAMRFPWDASLVPFAKIAPLARFDSYWYWTIAKHGYEWLPDGRPHNVVFYPLYPILVRALGALTGLHPFYAGGLISLGCLIAAAFVVGRLAEQDGYESGSSLAVMLAFPTAFFFLAVYSESVFLLLTAAFFLSLRKKNWWLVAATGALAALTRPTGLVLLFPVATALYSARRSAQPGEGGRVAKIAAVVSPLAGLMVFASYCLIRFGKPLLFLTSRSTDWHYVPAWPWWLAAAAIRNQNGRAIEGLVVLVFAAAGVALWNRHRDYSIYVLASLLAFVEGGNLISARRYVVVLFPAFFEFARWLKKSRSAYGVYLAASTLALVYLTARFALGYWVD